MRRGAATAAAAVIWHPHRVCIRGCGATYCRPRVTAGAARDGRRGTGAAGLPRRRPRGNRPGHSGRHAPPSHHLCFPFLLLFLLLFLLFRPRLSFSLLCSFCSVLLFLFFLLFLLLLVSPTSYNCHPRSSASLIFFSIVST